MGHKTQPTVGRGKKRVASASKRAGAVHGTLQVTLDLDYQTFLAISSHLQVKAIAVKSGVDKATAADRVAALAFSAAIKALGNDLNNWPKAGGQAQNTAQPVESSDQPSESEASE